MGLAQAQATPLRRLGGDADNHQPVMLVSDRLDYDQETAVATATGNVEVTQGPRTLLADHLIYDHARGVVTAKGNVTMLEPTGNVYFAHDVELTDDMKKGVVRQFRARLSDDSRFAAAEGRKVNEAVTELDYAVYSPCKPCKKHPERAPLWQLKAKKVRLDDAEQRVTYRDAALELWGVPVAYTPWFSHPTPDADRKSGVLIPKYEASGNLGFRVDVPVYWTIAPQMDATITPIFTSKEGPVIAGEFRHLTQSGSYELHGSITDPRQRDEFGNRTDGREVRSHIEAKGRFALSNHWRWGFDAKRASDDTYLRRYGFGNEDLLTSRGYVEGMGARTFVGMEAIAFQDLRELEREGSSPVALPSASLSHATEPGWRGSYWTVDANTLAILRDQGSQSRRVVMDSGWTLPHITPGGHVLEFRTGVRGDLYSIDTVDGPGSEGGVGRLLPEVSALWRYPLLRVWDDTMLLVEPIVRATASPHGSQEDRIPDEDAQASELLDSNLFSRQRFTGYDRVETGPRVTYGVQGMLARGEGRVSFMAGQSASAKPGRDASELLGYGEHLSDVVTRLAVAHGRAEASWRTRLDEQDLAVRMHEVAVSLNLHPLHVSGDFTALSADPRLGDRREVGVGARYALSENWTLRASGRRDVSEGGGMIASSAGVEFQNECLTAITAFNREFTRDRDIEPSSSVTFQVLLKNLN